MPCGHALARPAISTVWFERRSRFSIAQPLDETFEVSFRERVVLVFLCWCGNNNIIHFATLNGDIDRGGWEKKNRQRFFRHAKSLVGQALNSLLSSLEYSGN